MNRNFGKLADGKLTYAPDYIRIDEMGVWNPTAEMYAAAGWFPVVDEKPTGKVGVYYVPHGWEQVDGRIVRRYDERPVVAPPTVYIVEEIIYQLIVVGKLQAVKDVVGDYWELLTMRERIGADNEIFKTAYPRFRAALVAQGAFASEDEVDALLAKCREGCEDESGREVR